MIKTQEGRPYKMVKVGDRTYSISPVTTKLWIYQKYGYVYSGDESSFLRLSDDDGGRKLVGYTNNPVLVEAFKEFVS